MHHEFGLNFYLFQRTQAIQIVGLRSTPFHTKETPNYLEDYFEHLSVLICFLKEIIKIGDSENK